MATLKARGAIRVGRRSSSKSKRLVRFPIRRTALLGATAIAGTMVVMLVGVPIPKAYAASDETCGVPNNTPGDNQIVCNAATYPDGIDYVSVDDNLTIILRDTDVSGSDSGYNAGSINVYSADGYDIHVEPYPGTSNSITGTAVDGMFIETGSGTGDGGNITVDGINGDITATGTRSSDDTYGFSYTTSTVNGLELVSHGGDIGVTINEGDSLSSSGNGIYAIASAFPNERGTDGGNITVTNYGTITTTDDGTSGGDGIYAYGNEITINNLSTNSIHSSMNGINAIGDGSGGTITVWNGNGGVDNPDGLIDADLSGIYAENYNGGDIFLHSGNLTESDGTTDSAIFARGDYGMFAYSHSDGEGGGAVEVYNQGLLQLEGESGVAAIYARSSADVSGYALVANGVNYPQEGDVGFFNTDARINAYSVAHPGDSESDGTTNVWDADGIDIVKYGNSAILQFNDLEQFVSEGGWDIVSKVVDDNDHFGAAAFNFGAWDFSRPDNYLTPGFTESDTAAVFGEGDANKTTGGIFAPGGSAIRIDHYGSDDTLVWNEGTVIGQGNRYDPVIDITTRYASEGGNGTGEGGDGNYTLIYNSATGVMGSANTPFDWGVSLADLRATAFGWINAGQVDWTTIDNALSNGFVEEFADASDDKLLNVNWGTRRPDEESGSPVAFFNDGLAIGQLHINTEGGLPIGEGDAGSLFVNTGAWFTTKESDFFGGPNDTLNNLGLIQTAFLPQSGVDTRFIGLNHLNNDGIISMVDTAPGTESGDITFDRLYTSGDYYGGPVIDPVGGEGLAYNGYLAVDTFFGAEGDDGVGSDKFIVGGTASGSTGIIVHKLNTSPSDAAVGDEIFVVHADSVAFEDRCGGNSEADALCQTGNVFFISNQSTDYQNIGGYGTVRDGFLAWFLQEQPNNIDPNYYLRAAPSIDLENQTGVQAMVDQLWYDTVGAGDDNNPNNGGSGGNGGSGADLSPPTTTTVTTTTAPASKGALWGRMVGTWSSRDTSVTDTSIPLTYDTSLDQNTFSIQGGLEFHPHGGDSNLRLGVYGGYVDSSASFTSGGGTAKATGGLLGGYAGWNSGGWDLNTEVKADLLAVSFASPFVTVNANATNIGVLANAGYRMQSGGNSFIEPLASFAYLNTSYGNVSGGTLTYNNTDSIRAAVGARVGTKFGAPGATQTVLDLTGKVWDEFGGPDTVAVSDGVNTYTATQSISGIFGEVAGRATLYSADQSTSGYVSVGGTFGANETSVQAKAGVRKTF